MELEIERQQLVVIAAIRFVQCFIQRFFQRLHPYETIAQTVDVFFVGIPYGKPRNVFLQDDAQFLQLGETRLGHDQAEQQRIENGFATAF